MSGSKIEHATSTDTTENVFWSLAANTADDTAYMLINLYSKLQVHVVSIVCPQH